MRRNDWLPTISLGFSYSYFKGALIEEYSFTNAVDYYLQLHKELDQASIYRGSFQYHFFPGKRLRPFGTVGLGHIRTKTSLWTEEGLTEPDLIFPGIITRGFVGGGIDYYLMDLIQFRVALEWMAVMNYSFGLSISF